MKIAKTLKKLELHEYWCLCNYCYDSGVERCGVCEEDGLCPYGGGDYDKEEDLCSECSGSGIIPCHVCFEIVHY